MELELDAGGTHPRALGTLARKATTGESRHRFGGPPEMPAQMTASVDDGSRWRQSPSSTRNGGGCAVSDLDRATRRGMLLRRIGVLVAVIVLLFALARIGSIVVDWAWFSSIGYVGVFWTVFATKAALFVVVFAVSTLLLWANATLALRFTSRRPRSGRGPGQVGRQRPNSADPSAQVT